MNESQELDSKLLFSAHKKSLYKKSMSIGLKHLKQTIVTEPSSITFFCPLQLNYSTLYKYTNSEIIDHIIKETYSFRIILVNNDTSLFEHVLRKGFQTDICYVSRLMKITNDSILSPINKLLFFNLGIIQDITSESICKEQLKVVMFAHGMFIFSTNLNDILLQIFRRKFKFKFIEEHTDFFAQFTNRANSNTNQIDTINYSHRFSVQKTTSKFSRPSTNVTKTMKDAPKLVNTSKQSFANARVGFNSFKETSVKEEFLESIDESRNFSTDELIYWVMMLSTEKIEGALELITNESNTLKRMYQKISDLERSDFFRRLHGLESAYQVLSIEIEGKLEMYENCKIQFAAFNKATSDFYFKKNFDFFLEIIIARNLQAKVRIKKIRKVCIMIKENFRLIIENAYEVDKKKRNRIMMVVAFFSLPTILFAVANATLGVNLVIPFQTSEKDENSLIPFFTIIFIYTMLLVFQVSFFRWKKWT